MSDPETRAIADLREKRIMDRKFLIAHAEKEGREEGKIEGKIEGKKEKSIEIAKRLKEMHMSVEDIQKATDLTKEEIEKL